MNGDLEYWHDGTSFEDDLFCLPSAKYRSVSHCLRTRRADEGRTDPVNRRQFSWKDSAVRRMFYALSPWLWLKPRSEFSVVPHPEGIVGCLHSNWLTTSCAMISMLRVISLDGSDWERAHQCRVYTTDRQKAMESFFDEQGSASPAEHRNQNVSKCTHRCSAGHAPNSNTMANGWNGDVMIDTVSETDLWEFT